MKGARKIATLCSKKDTTFLYLCTNLRPPYFTMKHLISIVCLIAIAYCPWSVAQTTAKPTTTKERETLRRSLEATHFTSWEQAMGVQSINHSRRHAYKSEQADSLPFNPNYAPFYHGIASGDPLSDRVVIWTRVTPTNDEPVLVSWQIATDPAMTNIIQNGEVQTDNSRDYTVKVDVGNLQAGTAYYYRFAAFGTPSLIGRTRTAPDGDVPRLRFGVVSCSHYQQGYFNAYGRVADRLDLDAVIHLGDYIYEYGIGDDFDDDTVRLHQPEHEILSLADYRTRHSLYKLDPDLRRAHQQHAFITVWDDHEVANDAWSSGAGNHDASEGEYALRKQNALQAYFEWMPIRDPAQGDPRRVYRTFHYGNLADLIMIDTRHEGREEQVVAATDTAISNPNRTLLGTEQLAWIQQQLSSSTAHWRIMGNQVVISPINTLNIIPNFDMWDGYPAERAKVAHLIDSLAIKNVVFLTGDIHLGIAADVTLTPQSGYDPNTGATSFAVEFVTPSVTSANDEAITLPLPIETVENLGLSVNPHAKYLNIADHGYLVLDLAADKAQSDWYSIESREYPTSNENFEAARYTLDQITHLQTAAEPMPSLPDPPAAAPDLVVSIPNIPANPNNSLLLIATYPNPADNEVHVHYALAAAQTLQATLHDLSGKQIATLHTGNLAAGIYTLRFATQHLPEGAYLLRLQNNKQSQPITRKIVVKH